MLYPRVWKCIIIMDWIKGNFNGFGTSLWPKQRSLLFVFSLLWRDRNSRPIHGKSRLSKLNVNKRLMKCEEMYKRPWFFFTSTTNWCQIFCERGRIPFIVNIIPGDQNVQNNESKSDIPTSLELAIHLHTSFSFHIVDTQNLARLFQPHTSNRRDTSNNNGPTTTTCRRRPLRPQPLPLLYWHVWN